ncbi:unnamed protein product [Didymodactylos carnosus]|uniref:Structural maintenance of chromosomes protein 5 n=1 Tax=Didymodactylos carnosus TaxID=1234261 RepID=A0A813U8C0_9BILA|nr:unnamed protein product [Didymodactylos carnosus]CAF1404259.1 unnamed protein product [Didymodactylos carnosus]CAF3611860.1 unnamed protein product [Didymodactylos carnosus]CAF4210447.1 unnamed protein product [Didymodactylos carnosus]
MAINEKRNARTKLERKIAEKKQALALYQNKKIDLAKEEKSSREKEKKIHEDKLNKLNDHANYLNDYNQRCAELTIESCRLAISRYEHEKAKADLETHNEDLTKIKEESVQKQNQMKASETETRICAQNVIKSIGKTLPTNVSLLSNEIIMEVKSKFVGLPQTIQDLDTDIMSFTAQLNCQSNVKEDIIREYRNQTKKLADLEGRRQGLELRINQHQSTADNSKDNWLKQVKEMISQINEKFVDLFNTMGCKGEICLDVPENGDDYEKYGINIKVQFRDGEKLHEMSEFLQSGGEKSVSVMLYMIALQNMTICPFRCVDEINQGMDPQNERRVFELLVRHSSDKANSQYFLLSPKLLPDLKYSKKIKLLFVCNGEVALKSHEWNVAKYIERRKALQSL